MEFRILGPLEVWDGRGEVSLGGPKPRALLAVLLLDPGEVVPTDRLIDELWGEDSPERAGREVEKARTAGLLYVPTTRSPGYVIRVEPDALDLHRFERPRGRGEEPACSRCYFETVPSIHVSMGPWLPIQILPPVPRP